MKIETSGPYAIVEFRNASFERIFSVDWETGAIAYAPGVTPRQAWDAFNAHYAKIRQEERAHCAAIARDFAASRPLVSDSPSALVLGRYEGEQNAALQIARLIEDNS